MIANKKIRKHTISLQKDNGIKRTHDSQFSPIKNRRDTPTEGINIRTRNNCQDIAGTRIPRDAPVRHYHTQTQIKGTKNNIAEKTNTYPFAREETI